VQRIALIGPSGSGKTTLGRWLETGFDLPFIDLDDLHWCPGWIEAPLADFRRDVDRLTQAPRWAVAGNYAEARDLIWPRADTLIWLDLPLTEVLWRSTSRAVRQWWTAEPICNGNRQTLAQLLIGRDSLIGYTLLTFPRRRLEWPRLLAAPEFRHLSQFRLRSHAEVAAWQRAVAAGQTGNTPVDR
jgi:adenylate kinase family enzyme